MRTALVILLIFLFVSFATPSRSENLMPYIASCLEQDWLSIENNGPQEAIVKYMNSIESCSSPMNVIISAPNGIEVRIEIIIADDETIILTPIDPSFMSFPPESTMKDGAPMETFIIKGGMM